MGSINKTRYLLIIPFLLFMFGCGQQEENGRNKKLYNEVDKLKSLPYLNFSVNPSEGKSRVVIHDKNWSFPGYNLYVSRSLCLAELLDPHGNVVKSWQDDTFEFWQDFELLPCGTFLVTGKKRGDDSVKDFITNRALLKFSWQGEKLAEISIPTHHEVNFTPGKPIMTFLFDLRRIPEVNAKVNVLDNRIATVSDKGEVLENVSLYNLLKDNPDFNFQKVGIKRRGKRTDWHIDLLHSNTIEWVGFDSDHPIYSKNNIIITMRHQDAVAVIDWKDKKVIWTWGQEELSGPHDARVLENGNLLIFDNGINRGWSRVIEIDPIAENILWEYHAPELKDFYTLGRGANQRLPNENTLITESNNGRAFEVTPSGKIVWDFYNPHQNKEQHRATIIRMKRYPVDYIKKINRFDH